MLTDYHLHLRPDEDDTTFERYFTAENVERYRAAADAAGIEELGVSEHVYRFRQALDLWRHPLWLENADDDLDAYCEFVRSTSLRLGVECDFVPGAEERTAAMLEARDFDYVVGSVHFIGEGDAAVDHDGFDVWEARTPPPRRSGPATSSTSTAAPAPASSTSSPTPTWSRSGAASGRCRRATCAASTSPPSRRSWRAARRSSSRPRACASRSASSTRRAPSPSCWSRPGCRSRSPPTPTCPSRSASATTQAIAFLDELGVEEIAVFEGRRRRLEPLGSRVG